MAATAVEVIFFCACIAVAAAAFGDCLSFVVDFLFRERSFDFFAEPLIVSFPGVALPLPFLTNAISFPFTGDTDNEGQASLTPPFAAALAASSPADSLLALLPELPPALDVDDDDDDADDDTDDDDDAHVATDDDDDVADTVVVVIVVVVALVAVAMAVAAAAAAAAFVCAMSASCSRFSYS